MERGRKGKAVRAIAWLRIPLSTLGIDFQLNKWKLHHNSLPLGLISQTADNAKSLNDVAWFISPLNTLWSLQIKLVPIWLGSFKQPTVDL